MRKLLPLILFFVTCAILSPARARAQEEEQAPSLGDVARKARLEKQQQKDAQPKPVQASADAQTANPASAGTQVKDASSKEAASKTSAPKTADAKTSTVAADTRNPQSLKGKKIITNEELPEHVGSTHTSPAAAPDDDDQAESSEAEGKAPPDYWRTRILSEKNVIASLKSDIDSLSASIQYAGANCVSNCVQWNERQQQKQQQVETMKAQLEQQEKTLEDMQEMARKQGYGSSVYDP